MANTLRIKRRASGNPGAPASLENAELAYNEVDDILYYGKGSGGTGGSASTIEAIAGSGHVVAKTGNQTISGTKTFNDPIAGDVTGSAATLGTARNIAMTGDGSWSVNFNGSANVSGAMTLANSGVSAGTYTKLTVDAKGRAIGGAQAVLADLGNTNANFSMQGYKITGLATPTADQDAVNLAYVNGLLEGLAPKESVRAATTGQTALSNTQTIDGVAVAVGDRVLVRDQTNTTENGIYIVQSGAWTRSSDADTWAKLVSAHMFVEEGTQFGDIGFTIIADQGGTLGTDPIILAQFSGVADITAGAGLSKSGNDLSVNVANGVQVLNDNVQLAGQALALHNVAVGNNQLIYKTGAGALAATALTAYARGFLAASTAANARTELGLGDMALQNKAAVDINGGTIDNITLDGGTF